MSFQLVDLGTAPNANNGDPLRDGGRKINENFQAVDDALGQTDEEVARSSQTIAQARADFQAGLNALTQQFSAQVAAIPSILAGQIAAANDAVSAAESWALILQASTAGNFYESLTDPAWAARPNGEAGFVRTLDGDLFIAEKVAGVPTRRVTLLTTFAMRHLGINLWQYAKGDARSASMTTTASSNVVKSAVDLFTAADVGKIICIPGAATGNLPLPATITGFTDARTITLDKQANIAVTSLAQYGTNDRDAIQFVMDLATAQGLQINAGGPGVAYMIGGDAETYGNFTMPDGTVVPFKRGLLRLSSGLHIVGGGAKFLMSGGRAEMPCMFYHRFWNTSYLDNISFENVEIDGNYPNQIVTPIPANTSDDRVWQHGHGVAAFGYHNWLFTRCVVHGFRGAGLNIVRRDEDTNDSATRSRNLKVFTSTFYDNFSHDIGGLCEEVEIAFNTFKDGVMDARWVAALDIETLDANQPIAYVKVYNNTFDFRFGYGPTDTGGKYASGSQAAKDARRRYRRACTFSLFYNGYPNNIANGKMRSVSFDNNRVYCGSVDAFNWSDVSVCDNTFLNPAEAFPDGTPVSNCITVGQAANASPPGYVVGLFGAKVRGNRIEHAMASHGIVVTRHAESSVTDNTIKFCQSAGIRMESSAGKVMLNTIIDVGVNDDSNPDVASRGQYSAGITVFGTSENGMRISDNDVIDTRASPICALAVYFNSSVRPMTRIERNTMQNGRYAYPVKDVNGSARLVDNVTYKNNDGGAALAFTVNNLLTTRPTFTDEVIIKGANGAYLTFDTAANTETKISTLRNGKLSSQIQSTVDGALQFPLFDANGAFKNIPLALRGDGHLVLAATWDFPIELGGGEYIWSGDNQVLRTKAGRPTSVNDGVAVGSQA